MYIHRPKKKMGTYFSLYRTLSIVRYFDNYGSFPVLSKAMASLRVALFF